MSSRKDVQKEFRTRFYTARDEVAKALVMLRELKIRRACGETMVYGIQYETAGRPILRAIDGLESLLRHRLRVMRHARRLYWASFKKTLTP